MCETDSPTGKSNSTTSQKVIGKPNIRTVNDQSIQPGDGGTGLIFEVQGYKGIGPVNFYGSVTYLANPAETKVKRTITTPSVWGARPQAAAADVLLTWKQLIALHRQWHSLTRELKDAETALGQDNTEANYARLRDVKARLGSLEGTEALIEGFGTSSGRPVRSL